MSGVGVERCVVALAPASVTIRRSSGARTPGQHSVGELNAALAPARWSAPDCHRYRRSQTRRRDKRLLRHSEQQRAFLCSRSAFLFGTLMYAGAAI